MTMQGSNLALDKKNNLPEEDCNKISEDYRKLNDKCNLVIKKIKNRKKNKKWAQDGWWICTNKWEFK